LRGLNGLYFAPMNALREKRNEIRAAFLHSQEGTVFVVGSCLLLAWIATAAALWHAGIDMWNDVLAVGFAHLLAGRAISIAQGTQIGLSKWVITLVATYADIMVMFLVYPLFVYTYENLFEGRFFQQRMRPMLESAEKHVDRLGRFKIAGVFCFVWLPFWMTGIIVGSILGYLLGLRRWVTLAVASVAALAAVASWVYAYDLLFQWLASIHQEVPLIFSLLLIGGVVWVRLARRHPKLH
jgi:uncharacterized membrane protein